MSDLICDVINCCASGFAMGKLSVYYQIVIKNPTRRDEYQRSSCTNFI